MYVDRIAQFPSAGTAGWALKVNGVMQTAPDRVKLRTGDRVLWYWAQFGIVAGGPPTLALRRDGACYRVVSQDDYGASTVARGAVLQRRRQALRDAERPRVPAGAQGARPRDVAARDPLERAALEVDGNVRRGAVDETDDRRPVEHVDDADPRVAQGERERAVVG